MGRELATTNHMNKFTVKNWSTRLSDFAARVGLRDCDGLIALRTLSLVAVLLLPGGGLLALGALRLLGRR